MADYQGIKFKDFLKKKGISAVDAAKELTVSRQGLYDYFKSSSLKRETVEKILKAFLVNEGEIWGDEDGRQKLNQSVPRLEAVPVGLHDPEGFEATGEKVYELPDGSKIMEVKLIQHKAHAGFLRGFADPEFYEGLPTLKVSVNEFHSGTYLAFDAVGDSMTPSKIEDLQYAVLDGWRVIGRELPRHHWKYKLHTHKYSKWVIVHKTEGILIKQIVDNDYDNGTITIHSLNEKYPDQVLKLNDIDLIFNVVKTEINER